MDGKKGNEPEKSLTLRYLLENPALLQPPEDVEEEKCKEEKETPFAQYKQNDLTSAYLGPQIWSDMLLSDDLKLEPVDLDELLNRTGADDEMSDLNKMLMSSSPSKPVNRNEVQQHPPDDSMMLTYQDMPQLMSAHAPVEAKEVPSPSDYFCMQNQLNKPACQQQQQQQQQMPSCSSYQMQRMHSSVQQQQQQQFVENQAVSHNYKAMDQPRMDQSQFPNFSDGFDNPQLNSNPQRQPPPLFMPSQICPPAKRPRHSSMSAAMPQPPYPAILPRQMSNNDPVYGPGSSMCANMSPPVNGGARNLTVSPQTRTSPISPAEVHIPSPQTVNYVPNSADIIISTPQDANEGSTFDPSKRAFTEDELKPQPIIRKSKKTHVPADSKDGKYWSRRNKNNVAAKRSREARRIKENQIAMRASYLERENAVLKAEVTELRKELTRAVDLVKKYEKRFPRIPN